MDLIGIFVDEILHVDAGVICELADAVGGFSAFRWHFLGLIIVVTPILWVVFVFVGVATLLENFEFVLESTKVA